MSEEKTAECSKCHCQMYTGVHICPNESYSEQLLAEVEICLLAENEKLNKLNKDKFNHLQAYCKEASKDKAKIQQLQAENEKLKKDFDIINTENDGLAAQNSDLAIKCNKLQQQLEKMKDALRELYDQQNGPPLLRREKEWNAAMEKASECLADNAS